MKIVHIINNLNLGGAETLLKRICEGVHAKDNNIDFVVLIIQEKYDLLPQFKEANIPVEFVDTTSVPNWKRPFLLAKVIKKHNPDIVHTHLLDADRVGQPAAFLAGVKNRICTVHNMEIQRDSNDRATRKITSFFAKKIIVVSNSAKEFCIKQKLYPSKKMEVIYNSPGFDVKEVKPRTEIHTPLRILNVGRLHPQKGQRYLLEAVAKLCLKKHEVSVRIVGEGGERENLEEQIKKFNLESTITLVGQTFNVKKELEWADIFVAPSLYEGLPLAQIEAMMMGLPLILSDIPPHKEIIHNILALFCKVKNSDSLLEQIEKISKTNINELSLNSINSAKRFSFENMITQYLELYRGV